MNSEVLVGLSRIKSAQYEQDIHLESAYGHKQDQKCLRQAGVCLKVTWVT